jgi:putative acetyltransferase
MRITVDDLSGPEIAAFLEEHLADMRSVSPPESVHALDLNGLRKPEITFWTLWEGKQLVGCCALKELSQFEGELKSMRVARAHRNRGIGGRMVTHLIEEARKRNYQRLFLETGSMAFFLPARKLYEKFGFSYCPPFGSYREDKNSVFMTRRLA